MKKTSIFFILVAIALIITGVVMRNNAIKDAEKENLKLFKQTLTEDGNLVEIVDFASDTTNKVSINLSSGNINIIGNAEKSYAEIINFNTLNYAAYSNNRTFTIQDDMISSLVGRAEGGNIKFNGVRDYLRFEKHNSEKIINIYIASNATVKAFDIKLDKGNITLDNMTSVCDYNIILNKGNIECKNTEEISLLDAQIKNGNIKLDNVYIANTKINIQTGDITFNTPSYIVYNYNIENETGAINYDTNKHQGKFETSNENNNGTFQAHVGVGDVTITTFEDYAE